MAVPTQSILQPGAGAGPDPFFLLGMTERSGTNFLFHLVSLHPDCDYGGPIWENYLTTHLELLARFANAVYSDYAPEWNVSGVVGDEDLLLADMGRGLIRYLNRQRANGKAIDDRSAASAPRRDPDTRHLVVKTPSVKNLPLLPAVFPGARLILLVRDGRSVVESMVKSFGTSYEEAMRIWVAAARTVADFVEAGTGRDRPGHLLVRYEDIVADIEGTMRGVFAYLGLDPDVYDYAAARNAPVIGSSDTKATGDLHWRHLDRPKDFDPMRRWASWSPALVDRFIHLAAAESARLGYDVDASSVPHHPIGNRLQDIAWRLRRGI
jgi:hypothetical protein